MIKPFENNDRVAFIGDSITSGEGTYGAFEDMDWLTMYMSVSRNYAYMTAKELNADYHMISEGGWGVYTGWDNDIRHNIPSIYEAVCGSVGTKIANELGSTLRTASGPSIEKSGDLAAILSNLEKSSIYTLTLSAVTLIPTPIKPPA